MILADSSIWITHLRSCDEGLNRLLDKGRVVIHPYIVGELACGSLRNRQEILRFMNALPQVPVVSHGEVMDFIDSRKLMSKGIGYVDMHLLASAVIAQAKIWTSDKRLEQIAREMGKAL